jgi:peptidoglycan pentaglycine glycine transferase (the first glycine)
VSGSGATTPFGTAERGWRRSSVAERGQWDATVKALDGSVLQSWAWGEWYRQWGFELERIRVDGPQGTGLAQVMVWPHGPVAEARLARGPVLSGEDKAAVARELFAAVDEVCERHQPLTLTVEPPAPLPLAGTEAAAGFLQEAARWCCPGRTVIVPLLDDESLLRRMRKKTRQQVRRPERRGVTVEQSAPDAAGLMTFYALLDDTSRRTEFSIEPLSYYERFMRLLADEAILLFARTQRGVAAGLIITCFGNEAISHFGGSSSELRVPGATACLYFEAMRLARALGCTRFDLWGIPDEDPSPVEGPRPEGSRGGDWRGIHHFKLGLGGDVVVYPPLLERRYPARPRWAPWRRG